MLTNLVAIDDSPRFSAREAAALIAGPAVPLRAARERRPRRDRLAHGQALPGRVGRAEPGRGRSGGRTTDETLALIRDSVERGVQLELRLPATPAATRERRRVDPLRVESIDADWYLRGWCHLREAVRTFRLDRISNAVITDDADRASRAGEVRLPDVLFEASPDDLEVTIEVARIRDAAARRLHPRRRAHRPRSAAASAPPCASRTIHGLKRLIASMPGVVTVRRAAEQARRAVAEWAAAGAARYA